MSSWIHLITIIFALVLRLLGVGGHWRSINSEILAFWKIFLFLFWSFHIAWNIFCQIFYHYKSNHAESSYFIFSMGSYVSIKNQEFKIWFYFSNKTETRNGGISAALCDFEIGFLKLVSCPVYLNILADFYLLLGNWLS